MKRTLALIFVFLLLLNTYALAASPDINGEGALLIDGDSGRILYEKNSNERLYPASTTKIMTAILAIEYGKMDEMVHIDEEIVSLTKGSHIALVYDEDIKFEDLLNALLIASANDAAVALGKHISGSLEDFIDLMNIKAKELGAINTHFANPSGLHDDNHYTTAYDLYLIANYAMKNELFKEIVNKSSYVIPPTNKQEERIMHTTNRFLYGSEKVYLNDQLVPIKYEGVMGVKTGTTPEAQNCLVSFASQNNRNLFTIVLKAQGKEVYADTMKLMDHGFKDFGTAPIGYGNEFIENIDVENGTIPYVSAVLEDDVYYTLSKDEDSSIEKLIKIDKDIKAPISKGDKLGVVEYYLNEELVAQANIVSTLKVDLVPGAKLKDVILSKWYLFVFGFWFVFRLIALFNKSSKRRRRKSYYV